MSDKKKLTPEELGALSGRECTVKFGNEKSGFCTVNFKIMGVETNFGRHDLTIKPLSGGGTMKVSRDRVNLMGVTPKKAA